MYAVIDLGSNSFHLLIADCDGRNFSIVDRFSKKIQLAEGLATTGQLSPAAMKRGLACLEEFLLVLRRYPVQKMRVVATQAVRQASNSDEFVEQVKTLGLEIEIISGPREAELIFHGINNSLPSIPGNRLIIDIGGASTEIAIGNQQSIITAQSLPMGCVAWRDRFFSNGARFADALAIATAAARETLEPIRESLSSHDWSEVYASSGSAKMLYAISKANGWSEELVSDEALGRIEAAIAPLAHHSDIKLEGLKADRQDLLAPGLSIMKALMEGLGFRTIHYSKTALREGVLGEMMKLDSSNDGAADCTA